MVNLKGPRIRRPRVIVDLPADRYTVGGDLQGAGCITVASQNFRPPTIADSGRSERHQAATTIAGAPRRELHDLCANLRFDSESDPPREYGMMWSSVADQLSVQGSSMSTGV